MNFKGKIVAAEVSWPFTGVCGPASPADERCRGCYVVFITVFPKHLVNPTSLSFLAILSFPSDHFQSLNVFTRTPNKP